MKNITIALTAGDYNGVGPEILIKSLSDPELRSSYTYQVIGFENIFSFAFDRFSSDEQKKFKSGYKAALENLRTPSTIFQIDTDDFTPGRSTITSGGNAYDCLKEAVDCWKAGSCQGVVTGPIMKKTFFSLYTNFNGQTEWIAETVGSEQVLMIMAYNNLRVGLVTTHIPLKSVAESLTTELIVEKGMLFYKSLVSDFGILNPRIALCSLNPHASEGGNFGNEEKTMLEPAIKELRGIPAEWSGPHPSDTLFIESNMNNYDGILALYHDQGLIPFKMYCGFSGVNVSAGLPIVRTSPDHGVALNIAGKGKADHIGYMEAIRLAAAIVHRRSSTN